MALPDGERKALEAKALAQFKAMKLPAVRFAHVYQPILAKKEVDTLPFIQHLEATIPTGRAINPVSGTNWEGTGVQPDIPCAAAESLDQAHALALAQLAD